jgi:hypothetical protein
MVLKALVKGGTSFLNNEPPDIIAWSQYYKLVQQIVRYYCIITYSYVTLNRTPFTMISIVTNMTIVCYARTRHDEALFSNNRFGPDAIIPFDSNTFSNSVQLLPIIANDSLHLQILNPVGWNNLFLKIYSRNFPILALPYRDIWSNLVPSPIIGYYWMVMKVHNQYFLAIFAPGWTYAMGWFICFFIVTNKLKINLIIFKYTNLNLLFLLQFSH